MRRQNNIKTSIARNQDMGIILYGVGFCPEITYVDSTQVSGISDAPNGSVIEIFNDPQDEGEKYIGSTTVANGKFTFTGDIPKTGNITATATDLNGNTTEFSKPKQNPFFIPTPTPTRTPRPAATPKPTVTPKPALTQRAAIETVLTVESVCRKTWRFSSSGHQYRESQKNFGISDGSEF